MADTSSRYGTAEEIAEHIGTNFFKVSARTVRREWPRHGLAFVILNGRAQASFASAERVAQKIIQKAKPFDKPSMAKARAARQAPAQDRGRAA